MSSGVMYCPVDNEQIEQWATLEVICRKHDVRCVNMPTNIKPYRKPWIDPCKHEKSNFVTVESACAGEIVTVCIDCGQNIGERNV